ncbi:hypothetical protein [Vibrio phage vB_pir03]|nr:hypothetical protein [Vibrio phage vB_pir03]
MSIFGAVLSVVILVIFVVAFMLKATSLNDKASTNTKTDLTLAYNKAVSIGIWVGNVHARDLQKVLNRCKCLNKSHMEYELRRVLVTSLCKNEGLFITGADFDTALVSAYNTVRARHGL